MMSQHVTHQLALPAAEDTPSEIRLDGHRLTTTAAFHSYWYLAAERQEMFFRRLEGSQPPWTDDPILAKHRFTNAYRASDRVSQYLINEVIYSGFHDELDVILRVLLFKIFNRVQTWQALEDACGELSVATFDAQLFTSVLDKRFGAGERIYSAAYIMPSPSRGLLRKHANHLSLVAHLIADGTLGRIADAHSLRQLYELLLDVPSFGPFLAFQFAIDLNYGPVFDFSEMDFVVAGPGAQNGIAKCFIDTDGLAPAEIIRAVAEVAPDWLGSNFRDLWGRSLQLIDCQNLFCEVDKYARIAFPHITVGNGRTRIKQTFAPDPRPLTVAYPPKWGLPVRAHHDTV
jgi:hypothetical protein